VAAIILGLAGAAWFWHRSAELPPPCQPIPLTAYEGAELWPEFSPDGNQVVFSWNGGPDGKFHLYVKLVGAANHLQLTNGDSDETFPAWSPDGRWIAFQRSDGAGSHTLLVSPLGGPERKVGDGICVAQLAAVPVPSVAAFRMSWSTDSQWLVCSENGSEWGIILFSPFGSDKRRLTSPPSGQRDSFPAFSPDGHNLIFARTAALFDSDLFLQDLNRDLSPRGPPRGLTINHFGIAGLAWTPDGRDAIWGRLNSGLYRIPVFRSGSIELLPYDNAIFPALTRRQNRLVYSMGSRNTDIWRTDGHTSERHPVSSTQIDGFAHFSPDGKRIVLSSMRSGRQEIWVANADGTQTVPVTNLGGSNNDFPRWSPDGRWIAFRHFADGAGNVWVVDADGGTPHPLSSRPAENGLPNFSIFHRRAQWPPGNLSHSVRRRRAHTNDAQWRRLRRRIAGRKTSLFPPKSGALSNAHTRGRRA
jgi:Tol biopolymer transport system component